MALHRLTPNKCFKHETRSQELICFASSVYGWESRQFDVCGWRVMPLSCFYFVLQEWQVICCRFGIVWEGSCGSHCNFSVFGLFIGTLAQGYCRALMLKNQGEEEMLGERVFLLSKSSCLCRHLDSGPAFGSGPVLGCSLSAWSSALRKYLPSRGKRVHRPVLFSRSAANRYVAFPKCMKLWNHTLSVRGPLACVNLRVLIFSNKQYMLCYRVVPPIQ